MPIKSKLQMKAMYAASKGNSTLGIPKKVAKEYIKSGKEKSNLPERKAKRK